MRKEIYQGLMTIATDVTMLLSQIATEENQPGNRISDRGSWCCLRDSCGLSFVKGESDPKRCALVDDTLHTDRPTMFLDNTFHDRET
jgi:hypothetical protein